MDVMTVVVVKSDVVTNGDTGDSDVKWRCVEVIVSL